MKSVLVLLAFFAAATALPYGVSVECPTFWTRFQGNCYRFFGAATTWDKAEAHCQEFFILISQGHLVSLHSDAEHDFVEKLWQTSLVTSPQITSTYNPDRTNQHPGDSLLIGYNDKQTEGTFTWSDGTNSNYVKFLSNQPDDTGGNEDCVDMIHPLAAGSEEGWNDIPCSWTTDLPYMCKLKAHATPAELQAFDQEEQPLQ